MNVNEITKDEWIKCQIYEKESWGNSVYLNNALGEIYKQNYYAECMGLIETMNVFDLDLDGKSVLDVGCGPVSMLLRSKNFKRAVGVEPIMYSDDMLDIYKSHNITLYNIPAEEMDFGDGEFDEVWMYNVLQHVYNPYSIIEKLIKYGKRVRIYEWIDIPAHEGHPHCLTENFFVVSMNLSKTDYKIVNPNDDRLVGKAIVIDKFYK